MTYTTALSFYGTGLKIAQVLQIKPQAIYQWKKKGVVPLNSALRLQTDSRGRVKVDPKCYEKPGKKARV